MRFDLNNVYKTFADVKEKYDFKEYCDEIDENNKVMNTIPFDEQKARQRISKLTTKYQVEFNILARIYGNNMSVINQPVSRTSEILWNDLQYINKHIPLFALERKGISNYLNQKINFEIET